MADDVPNIFGSGDNAFTLLGKLLSEDHIKSTTVISNDALREIAKLKTYSERGKEVNQRKNDVQVLSDDVIPYILEHKPSVHGMRSKQIIEAFKNMNKEFLEEKKENMIGGMFGK